MLQSVTRISIVLLTSFALWFPLKKQFTHLGERKFEINFVTNQGGFFEFYLNSGKGFNENEVIRENVSAHSNIQTIFIQIPQRKIYSFRLDPQINDADIKLFPLNLKNGFGFRLQTFELTEANPNREIDFSHSSGNKFATIATEKIAGDPYLTFYPEEPILPNQIGQITLNLISAITAFVSSLGISLLFWWFSKIEKLKNVARQLLSLKRKLDHFLQSTSFIPIATVCAVAYLFLPYHALLRYESYYLVFFLVSFLIIVIWSFLAAGKITSKVYIRPISKSQTVSLVILISFSFLITFRRLFLPIAIRGDESYHFQTIAHYLDVLRETPFALFILMTTALVTLLNIFRVIRFGTIGILVFLSLITYAGFQLSQDGHLLSYLKRYPSLFKVIVGLPVTIIGFGTKENFEWTYRLFPYFSFLLIPCYLLIKSKFKSQWLALLLAISAATVPSLVVYSGMVYHELPVVFLLTVIIFNIDKLGKCSVVNLKTNSFWYALATMGFIKETLLPVIPAILLARALLIFCSTRSVKSLFTKDNVVFAFVIVIPLAYYVLLRKLSGDPRGYSPNWENFSNWYLYQFLIKTFWEQFGVLVLGSLIGIVSMLAQKRFLHLISVLIIGSSSIAFFFLDFAANVGYSRFNLYLIPTLLFLTYEGVKQIEKIEFYRLGKYLSYLTVVALITGNLFFYPLTTEGVKKPKVFSNTQDTREQSFPLKKGFDYIRELDEKSTFSIILHTYDYFWQFYLDAELLERNTYRAFGLYENWGALDTTKINESHYLLTITPIEKIKEKAPGILPTALLKELTYAGSNTVYIYKILKEEM
ncbi:MAG: hypothetical protein MI748_17060 [Opitutales bacterium]|nr:hypothetical protein [Opitutales bacterium]